MCQQYATLIFMLPEIVILLVFNNHVTLVDFLYSNVEAGYTKASIVCALMHVATLPMIHTVCYTMAHFTAYFEYVECL